VIRRKGKPDEPIRGVPKGDMLFFELAAEGNYVAARPSGTEPKVKFYTFAYDPPEASRADLDAVKAAQRDRLAAMDRELREIAAKYAS
jgi:phosphoglucomutase/phosphomannomutase